MTKTFIAPATIERIADQVREDAAMGDGYGIDIERAARNLGFGVEYVDFEGEDAERISAKVERPAADQFTIQIAAKEPLHRQRFSIAHEVAHIILHAPSDPDSDFAEYRQPITNYGASDLYKETQANMLAASILMPKEKVIDAWRDTGSIDEIAQLFSVSLQAAYYRLEGLGLLDNG